MSRVSYFCRWYRAIGRCNTADARYHPRCVHHQSWSLLAAIKVTVDMSKPWMILRNMRFIDLDYCGAFFCGRLYRALSKKKCSCEVLHRVSPAEDECRNRFPVEQRSTENITEYGMSSSNKRSALPVFLRLLIQRHHLQRD